MKMNEKMFAAMRDAANLLQQNGALAATEKIQQTLKEMMPEAGQGFGAMPQAPSAGMRDINAPPAWAGKPGAVNGFVPDLLAGLGLASPPDAYAFKAPSAVPPFAQPAQPAQPDTGAGGRFLAGVFTGQAGTRHYKLYVPSGYQGQPLPLVVMLHGCTQNPDDFAAGTRMNEIAEQKPCLVLYPAQAQSANGSKCWNWFNAVDQRRGQGEPSIIAGMTQEIIKTWQVDPRQVYIAGLSAGGAMAIIMGTTYPELYAAVGIHSGLPYASAHDLPSALAAMKGDAARRGHAGATKSGSEAIPVIVFHGDRDKTVHPRNGDQIVTGAIPGGAAGTQSRAKVPDGHAYTRTVHSDDAGRVIAEQWLVHGAGHAWSGGSSRGSYTDGKGPDASKEMMRFFSTRSQS
ncbi:MAG: esterase [Herminiimonas sp.]|nr:esterase [Herminiimonas sp.]